MLDLAILDMKAKRMQTKLKWTFSSQVTREELASTFLNQHEPLSADQMSEILAANPLTLELHGPEAVKRISDYLQDNFPGASYWLINSLMSFLSRPNVDDFFLNMYVSDKWPIPATSSLENDLHRYVCLLLLALDSNPSFSPQWPFGRSSLTEFDGNVGMKAIANIEHGGNPLLSGEPPNPFRVMSFLNDIIDFGLLLVNFADDLNDPIWNSWLTAVNAIRINRGGEFPARRFDARIDEVLTAYLDVRGIDVHAFASSLSLETFPRDSAFRTCLRTSVELGTPTWAKKCSQAGQRLAGLIVTAIAKDPFSRIFLRVENYDRPLVQCDFHIWAQVLELDEKAVLDAFTEIDNLRMKQRLPFDFNT